MGQYFSRRETECIFLIAQGLTTAKVAERLQVAKRTVENYLENARLKANCENRVELVTFFLKRDENLLAIV